MRVYVGEVCHGQVYLDDGHTFDYRRGDYLRENFTCRQNPDGSLSLIVDRREGSYKPWWTSLHFEIYGWTPTTKQGSTGHSKFELHQAGSAWSADVDDNPNGVEAILR